MDQSFLDILVCPQCRGKLDYNDPEQTLSCWECKLQFAIDDGIPIMMLDEATPIQDATS
jgi:uncharacterized protein